MSRRNGQARSRSREKVAVRALIAAIRGETLTAPNEACEVQAQIGASKAQDATAAASGQLHRVSLRSLSEKRAVSCRALLEAARGPVGVERCSTAMTADGQTTLPVRFSRLGRNVAVIPPAADPVLSHALLVTGTVTWCRTCGAYADARVRSFRGRCTGPPLGRGGSGRTSIRRLLAGCHPLSGEHLGARALSLR